MVKCVIYGLEEGKYYVQTCCDEEHHGQECGCKSYAENIEHEEDAKFLAECIADKLNVSVKNRCTTSGCGFSDKTVQSYLDNLGNNCPVCGSPTLEGECLTLGTGSAYQKIKCLDCHASWFDNYKLSGIELIDYDD